MNLQDFKLNNYQAFFEESDKIITHPLTEGGSKYYGYIPKTSMDPEIILSHLEFPESPKIVDLGAGYCENLLNIGSCISGSKLYGVENHSRYVADMERMIRDYDLPITMIEQDALAHDISVYDLIYSFCLCKMQPEYDQFNDFVLANMKVGAYWLEALSVEPDPKASGTVLKAIARASGTFSVVYNEKNIILVKKISNGGKK